MVLEMLPAVKIKCPFCLERQEVLVEPDDGHHQHLIVDCEICCHPLDVHVSWNEERQKFSATVEKGSGF